MGKIKQHPDVKIFVGLTVNDKRHLPQILNDLVSIFGPSDLLSEWFEVDPFTDYYLSEMGKDLQKIFISFEDLNSIELLSHIKIETNLLESKYANQEKRTINIDPGYLTEAKAVLATTKDYSHRLYLDQGIYGDLHLVYREGSFRPQEWTYPDYKQNLAIRFFNTLRIKYKNQIL